MNNLETLPKTLAQVEKERGIITLKAVYKNAGAFTVCPVKDPNRPGFYMGVERLSDDEKKKREYYVDPEKLNLKIKDGRVFDLSKIVDRLNWEWVKHIPEIAMSYEQAQHSSYEVRCYVKIEEVESQKTVSRINLKLKALNLVDQDEPLNYSARARLLGMDMRGQTTLSQKEFLLEEAERSPQKVINVYNSDTLGVRLLLLNALDKGIINFDQSIYSYNTVALGMNEDAVVEFLTRPINQPLRDLIQRDLAETVSTSKPVKVSTPLPTQARQEEAATVIADDISAQTASRPRGGHKID